jgi:hypothetical protein
MTLFNLSFLNSTPIVVSTDPLHSTFKLPITYVPSDQLHTLSPLVSSDLELATTMYDHLLKPTHVFGKNLISEWNKQFTTHVPFLEDSQKVLRNMPLYLEQTTGSEAKCDKIIEIWKDTKQDIGFLEKYSYIEWDALRHLNESSTFLQTVSVINMTSPILSFIIPLIFLIFPFVLLKIQGVPIGFSTYIDVLKDIARHHFIGSMINNLQSISWNKLIYFGFTVGLYFLQIYQNYNLCIKFYKNIHKINSHLYELRDYLGHSMLSMETFIRLNSHLPTYTGFIETTRAHCETLREFSGDLELIKPFAPGLSKVVEIGYLLKCFYKLHSVPEYENSLKYSIGFEGFINNLTGISQNLAGKHVALAKFVDDDAKCNMKQQYYPAYVGGKHVKNNYDSSKNIVITGPNASGKTTILKSTTINIIFTQQFGTGFYDSCSMNPYTHIHSYLNIPDTSGRDSLFQAESRRCKEIIDSINATEEHNSRHFCIFDELYSGTNPTEATQAAHAFLMYLSKRDNVQFILTTHYISLCKKLKVSSQIQNYMMTVESSDEFKTIKYNYKMKKGISKVKGGILILEEMNYPCEIIDTIRNNL